MTEEAPGPARESASQQKRAAAAANDAAVLRLLAATGDAGLSPRDLATRAGLTPGTARAAVRRLAARRLVVREGERGSVQATMAGRSEVGAGTPGVAFGAALEAAIEHFPAEAQRAFARLLLSGIVARRHLARDYPVGWGGFIVVGPTKTAKTSLAAFACQVFGLPSGTAVRVLRDETPGSIFGRRQQTAGRQWRVSPSALLSLPFLCLDEYDKAPEEVRREADRLLLGQTSVEVEGESFPVLPVPLVVLNARPAELAQQLHEAYVRRSPVLDTGELGGLLRDIDEDMRKLFRPGVIPQLDLGTLKPPPPLSDDDRAKLRDGLRSGLTEEGWRLVDVEATSRLALGRVPLMGAAATVERACLATALDYLIVTSTVPGHVRPGAIGELRGQLGGDVAMVARVETHLSQQTTLVRLAQDQRAAKLATDVAFVADRAKLAARLKGLVERLGRRRDPEASAVKAALRKLAKDAEGCRSREGLDAVDAAALPWGERAKALLDRWAVEAQRADQAKLDAAARRREAAQAKGQQAPQRTQAHREAVAQRRAWVRVLRALYRIPPYESPGAALGALVKAGWLEVAELTVPAGTRWWDLIALSGTEHLVTAEGVPGWPEGARVDERAVGDFWAAACDLAEGLADRSQLRQRPLWRSRWDDQQAREDARDLRRLGL